MLTVIADDITGAAEIAGIALRNGLDVHFVTGVPDVMPQADVLVIATDTRSGSEEEARDVIANITAFLKDKAVILFKKTDSALRGHITTELKAIMDGMCYKGCLLIPQNPSKGRIIRDGRYYIGDIPLDETSFSYDPEFPAKTSYVTQRLNGTKSLSLDEMPDTGICIADAVNDEEMDIQVGKVGEGILLAGAADCFNTFLRQYKKNSSIGNDGQPVQDVLQTSRRTIIICGSTQSKSLKEEPYIKSINAEEVVMPDDVFHGAPANNWIDYLENIYGDKGSIVISVGHAATGGKDYALRLRNVMAVATSRLVTHCKPDLLIIEGGATAFAILHRIGWHHFTINKEYDAGVVGMSCQKTHVILKPGSYPWGKMFRSKKG